jgi:hypothetical protein
MWFQLETNLNLLLREELYKLHQSSSHFEANESVFCTKFPANQKLRVMGWERLYSFQWRRPEQDTNKLYLYDKNDDFP